MRPRPAASDPAGLSVGGAGRRLNQPVGGAERRQAALLRPLPPRSLSSEPARNKRHKALAASTADGELGEQGEELTGGGGRIITDARAARCISDAELGPLGLSWQGQPLSLDLQVHLDGRVFLVGVLVRLA